jgi:hypothetical protein
MADKIKLPQIPSTVWWGVRAILNKTPNATIDGRFLSIQLNVQEVAAKQYISELMVVGILSEDFKATPLANKWRLDTTYKDAVEELIANVYPQSLRETAPANEGDRQKAITWFQQEGLGEGSAKNKAATYFLLGTENPNEAPPKTATARNGKNDTATSAATRRVTQPAVKAKVKQGRNSDVPRQRSNSNVNGSDAIPLNVNVQIHISADAGSEQIESIFSAMRRYLYDKQTD